MPITIYPGSMKKRNANGSYSDLVPAIGTDPEVLDDFAEEYDPTVTYNIGDYCIHNSDFYKCNTNNTTGTWNNNAWDRVSVADELADQRNTLNQLVVQSSVVTSSSFTNPISCPGLTASHVVCNWGLFSDFQCTSPLDPNNPPADITIEEGAGQYNLTIQNSSGTFYLKPTFILP